MEKVDALVIIDTACKVPGVKIDRENYLYEQFHKLYPDMIDEIIRTNPRKAGVSQEEIKRIAENSINFEVTKATSISALAGLPGGIAMIGTIPADLAQFYAHVFRIMQKLMYLYGWMDLGKMDDGTKNILIVFLGVMFGVNGAENALRQLALIISTRVEKVIAAKALTKTTLYPIIQKILAKIGIKLTKDVFAKTISKSIPIIGGILNGTLTLVTIKPMSKKLLKVLNQNQI